MLAEFFRNTRKRLDKDPPSSWFLGVSVRTRDNKEKKLEMKWSADTETYKFTKAEKDIIYDFSEWMEA